MSPVSVAHMARVRTHHVGVTVSDLDSILPFYRDVLGLDVVDRFEVSGEAFETAVDVEGAVGRFAHLEAGGDVTNAGSVGRDGESRPDETRIELVEYEPGTPQSGADRLDQRGAKHLGFAVDDLPAYFEALPADVAVVSEPQTTSSGTTIVFLRDPEDNLIEILEG